MKHFDVDLTYLEVAMTRLKAEIRRIIIEGSKKLGGDADGERTDV